MKDKTKFSLMFIIDVIIYVDYYWLLLIIIIIIDYSN